MRIAHRPCALFCVALAACSGDPGPVPGALLPSKEAEPSPARADPTELQTLEALAIDPLSAASKDARADLFVFVRTDCPISNRYAPTLARIVGGLGDSGVDVWRVYVDPDETPAMIRAHETEYSLPGTALRDPAQAFAQRVGVTVTPEVALYDADQSLVYRGRIDDWYVDYGKPRAAPTTHELVDALAALAKGEAPKRSSAPAVGCPLPVLPSAAKPSQRPKTAIPGEDGVVPEHPTFTEHIAPIVVDRCASCHRPDQVAPFSLLEEGQVRDHATQIVEVTASKFMPPWKPVRGYGEFADDRSLTEAQVEIFRRWVELGMPVGPEAARVSAPVYAEGWTRGKPDLVLELPEAYVVPAEGLDIYRNFVLPSPATRKRWVRGWELDPGNPRVVHHAILNVDQHGWAAKADAEDPGPGFESMELTGSRSPSGSYLVWTPGQRSTQAEHGGAWLLKPDMDLVLQMHVQPSGKPETVSPRIGLFFGEPPPRTGITLRVGDVPIDIPAGDAEYVIEDEITLLADADLVSVFPHAHYLAVSFASHATLPDGSRVELLRIDDWDFSWQDQYRYREPVRLPAGSRVHMKVRYDNSAANPRNPNQPPKRVRLGPKSEDEMGNLTFEALPRDRKGMLALREGKYRRALERGGGKNQHYNLANVLRDQGDLDGAVGHYQKALEADPQHVWSLRNLSMVYLGLENVGQAVALAKREVAVNGGSPGAHNNLGTALAAAGRTDQAATAFRRALSIEPKFELAIKNLALLGLEP